MAQRKAMQEECTGRLYGLLLQPGGIPDAETDIWTGYPHDNARGTEF